MNETVRNSTERILGAILGGCISAVAVACILLPLVYLVSDNFFELDFGDFADGGWINMIIIAVICLAWLFISMMGGGYVAARIAHENEYHITWTIISIGFVIYIMYASEEFRSGDLPIMFILILVGILGALAGCHSGIRYKEKRKKHSGHRTR